MATRKTVRSEVPFGMCLTGNHDRCHVEVMSQGKLKQCPCECENHGVNYKPTGGPSQLLLDILDKYRK